MDDVVLISEKPEELQEMLNITNEIGTKYRIKFGEEKSKIMKIGRKAQKSNFKFSLGDMNLQECSKYKYLGVMLSGKRNLEEHLNEVKRKVEAAFNTIMAIAGSSDLKNIEMKTIWTTLEACVTPTMTYGMEAFSPTKKEKTQMKQMLDNILKRIIMTPRSTPWEPLYIETGTIDVNSIMLYNKLLYREKIKEGNNNLLKTITQLKEENGWEKRIKIELEELMGHGWKVPESERRRKRIIKTAIREKMIKNIEESGATKSKTTFYLNNKEKVMAGKRAPYMDLLSRREVSAIFAARTRMLDVKANFKNKYSDTKCRWCRTEDETQQHIMEECVEINRREIEKTTTKEIFTEEIEDIKKTARKIIKIKEILSAAPP